LAFKPDENIILHQQAHEFEKNFHEKPKPSHKRDAKSVSYRPPLNLNESLSSLFFDTKS
jgi:hypothetical protein